MGECGKGFNLINKNRKKLCSEYLQETEMVMDVILRHSLKQWMREINKNLILFKRFFFFE